VSDARFRAPAKLRPTRPGSSAAPSGCTDGLEGDAIAEPSGAATAEPRRYLAGPFQIEDQEQIHVPRQP
jgi:hypothetical protein